MKELKKIQKQIADYKKLSNIELVMLERDLKSKVDILNIIIEERKQVKDKDKPKEGITNA